MRNRELLSPLEPIFCLAKMYFAKIVVQAAYQSVGGIVVSIVAFQAIDPGSIPGRRKVPFFPEMVHVKLNNYILSAYH